MLYKKEKYFKKFFLCLVILFMTFFNNIKIYSQDKKTILQNNKKKLAEEIALTNKMLNETRKNKETSINQLNLLNIQIKKREDLINSMSLEIIEIDKEITSHKDEISEKEISLNQLKDALAKLIYYAYKTRKSQDKLMYIFAAKDFHQAYMRLKYIQMYSLYIKSYAEQIKRTQDTLTLTVENLNKIRQEKTELLNKQQEEKLKLAKTINEKNITISKLKKKENELRQIIKKKEKAAKDLQNAINKLIQEEITMSAKKAGTKPVKDKLTLVPEEVALSNDFSSNKGKLPWPIEKGFISTTFGSHPHPVISGIIIKNDGLNFTTTKGSTIRSIFKGKVSAVISIPNYNNVVMIRHGEYLSVYANLATVYVKTGDYVKTKQAIGMIYYDEKEDNATIHFELRKGTTILNPAEWLIK